VSVLAYYKYQLIIQLATQNPNFNNTRQKSIATCYASIALAMIAGLFLVDSIRRLHNSFKANRYFSENKSKMWLHVFAIFVSQICLFAVDYFLNESLKNPDKYNTQVDLLRIFTDLTIAVSQGIFIYLLVQFSKTVERTWTTIEETTSGYQETILLKTESDKMQTYLSGKTLSPRAQQRLASPKESEQKSKRNSKETNYGTKSTPMSP
jgi:hypothetical protein